QWYSRDVQAIAAARGLTHVAPYFIDAQASAHEDASASVDEPTAHVSTPAPIVEPTAHVSTPAPIAEPTAQASTPAPTVEPTAHASTSAPIGEPSTPGDKPASAGATVAPVPGLTVIHFHNSHLVYAITWYTLALMTALAIPLGMR